MSNFKPMADIDVAGIVFGLIIGSVIGVFLAFTHNVALFTVVVTQTVIFFVSIYTQAARSSEALPLSKTKHLILLSLQWNYVTGISAVIVGLTSTTVNWLLYGLPGKYMNLLALAVVPVGYAAHYFKMQNPLLYGILEVLIGMATAIGSTARTEFQPTQGIAIIGAIYVVARGFNDIADARAKEAATSPIAPIAPLPS